MRPWLVLMLAATSCASKDTGSPAVPDSSGTPASTGSVSGSTTGTTGGTTTGVPAGTTGGTPTGTPPGPDPQAVCGGYNLDPLQTMGDGLVTYCHADPGVWLLLTTSIGGCLQHVAHPNDRFPTWICPD